MGHFPGIFEIPVGFQRIEVRYGADTIGETIRTPGMRLLSVVNSHITNIDLN